jgi:hypothetical protein
MQGHGPALGVRRKCTVAPLSAYLLGGNRLAEAVDRMALRPFVTSREPLTAATATPRPRDRSSARPSRRRLRATLRLAPDPISRRTGGCRTLEV